jgi:hypothetical protein
MAGRAGAPVVVGVDSTRDTDADAHADADAALRYAAWEAYTRRRRLRLVVAIVHGDGHPA